MLGITNTLRALIWIITGIASLTFAILVIVLEKNLSYVFRRIVPQLRKQGGRPPAEKPILLWILFWVSAITVIMGTAYASSAPEIKSMTGQGYVTAIPTLTLPSSATPDILPNTVQILGQDANILAAYDRKGNPLWQKQVDSKIMKAILVDLDGNGGKEVLVGLDQPGDRPGWVIVYDELGNLVSMLNLWDPPIYAGGKEDDARIVDYEVEDINGDGKKDIAVISNDTYWYASKLSILEYSQKRLRKIANYWNPGLLYTLDIDDLENDRIMEIVITGVNNDLQAVLDIRGNVHVIFLLTGKQISGQAPPWFGKAPEGAETWYGFIMPRETRVTSVDFEDKNDDGIREIHAALSDACSFYLDRTGTIIARGRGSACQGSSELHIISK